MLFPLVIVGTGFAHAQSGCPVVSFQTASSANLKPSSSSHVLLTKQNDGSYTANEVGNASPYRLIRTTANFQRHLTACPPGPPAPGSYFGRQLALARLDWGGYLVVGSGVWFPALNPYYQLNAAVFDSSLNLISESQFPGIRGSVGALALADLNVDGNPDIVAGTNFPHSTGMQILLGNGGSSFKPPVVYEISTSVGIASLVVGDLNGDHKLDVAISGADGSKLGSKISLYFGNGDGSFRPESVIAAGAGALALGTADVNRDGKEDLAFTAGHILDGGSPPAVGVLLGLGDGKFAPPTQFPVGGSDSLAVADMDGDGILDIVSSGVTVLLGDGKGGFSRRRDYWQETPGSIIPTDFDGDGKTDIVIGVGNASILGGDAVSVLFNHGGRTFSGAPVSVIPNLATPNNSIYELTAADFNNDRIPDLAVKELFRVRILKGNGDGTFTPGFEYQPVSGYTAAMATADFNNDGKTDLAVGVNSDPSVPVDSVRMDLFLGRGDGTFQKSFSAPTRRGVKAMVAADFNGDTKQDVALLVSTLEAGFADEVLLYFGDGKGGLSPQTSYPVGPKANDIAMGDFNGDGIQDLVVTDFGPYQGRYGNLRLLFGKGYGAFSPAAALQFSDSSPLYLVKVTDFNRDRKLDLVVTMFGETLAVLLGRGDGTFQAPLTFAVSGTQGISAADLNGDANPDVIVWGGASPGYLLGNGDGTFQPEVRLATNAWPLLAVDLNGDGRLDVVAGARLTGIAGYLNVSQKPPPLSVVSAASLAPGPLAAESLATGFGEGLASATVSVLDATGTTRTAPLLCVSPKQVNFVVPAGTSTGNALVTIISAGGVPRSAAVHIAPVAPSLFAVNSEGLAAAYLVRVGADAVQTVQPVFALRNGTVVPVSIDLGPPAEQVYLILFGTGIRNANVAGITVHLQGLNAPVSYAGPHRDLPGLDQVNVLLPRELAGTGEVSIVLNTASTSANTVQVWVK